MACGSKTRLHTLHWLTTGTKCTPLFAERIPFRLGVTFRLGAAAQSAVAWSPRRSTAACWIPISATWEHRAWYERSPDASNRPSDRDILKNFLLFFSHEARASWASYRVADGRTDRQTLRLTYTIDMGTVDVAPPRATEVRAIRSRLVMTDSQWRVDGPNRRCVHGGRWSVSVRPGPGCARPCVVFRSRFGSLAHWVSARRIAQEEVKKARIPMANRDYCVDSLIPLNECRRENYYLPWKCEHERHAYELCQYKLYKLRTQK